MARTTKRGFWSPCQVTASRWRESQLSPVQLRHFRFSDDLVEPETLQEAADEEFGHWGRLSVVPLQAVEDVGCQTPVGASDPVPLLGFEFCRVHVRLVPAELTVFPQPG